MADPTPLTDQALARLRAYAKDNGLAPESIEILKTKEALYALQGRIKLAPSFHIETSQTIGRLKSKGTKPFASFAELREEIVRRREAFQANDAWIQKAIKEIEKTPGHGWGHDDSAVSWPGQTQTLTATENCPSCRGTGQSPCTNCQGLGTTVCLYCQGREQEICPTCNGKGEDPANPSRPCPVCNGKRFILCRYCHGTGKVPCDFCQGKGQISCTECRGSGFLSQEARLTEGATVTFSLGRTTDMPSGLLRVMDRLGLGKLGDGWADISMRLPSTDPGAAEDKTTVFLEAKIPYADIRLKLGDQTVVISAFGKKGRLSSVPPFLDRTTDAARQKLAQAAQGRAALDEALTVRLIREALDLILKGKRTTNDLRRLYPVGLSGKAAQDIMADIDKALKAFTVKARAIIGGSLFLLSAVLFVAFLFSDVRDELTNLLDFRLIRLVAFFIPVMAMGVSWLALHHTARWVLGRKYPNAALSQTQNIGKLGYGFVLGIGVLYVLLFFLESSGLVAALLR